MTRRGIHHLGVATYDYDRCVDFYTRVLGLDIAWQDLMQAPDGTVLMRHVWFDTGDGSYIAFMAPTPESGAPEKWAGDLNSAVGLSPYTYHFALWLDTVEELGAMASRLQEHGVKTTPIWDHEWCKSIYFRDPDGLALEFCVTTRKFTDEDKLLKPRHQPFFDRMQVDREFAEQSSEATGIPVETWVGTPDLEEAHN
jgi:catechol 2,3-dioxygenase-like lactoylglutathione lyase family enzyme